MAGLAVAVTRSATAKMRRTSVTRRQGAVRLAVVTGGAATAVVVNSTSL